MLMKTSSRNPSPMSKPLGTHRPINGSAFSMLGSDTAIAGNINATADLHIDGRVEGDIACTALVQGEGSEVVGAITAESARIAGRIEGSVTAREVVILKSARIRGDIVYDALTIEQGAQLDGRLTPRTAHSQTIARAPDGNETRLILAAPDKD
jgi:cytoskeletal protein CcmA (bactofilin family)